MAPAPSGAPTISTFDGEYRHILFDIDFNAGILTRYSDGGSDSTDISASLATIDTPSAFGSSLLERVAVSDEVGKNSASPVQVGYYYMFRVEGKDISASMQAIADGFMANSGEIPYAMEGI